MQTYIVTYTGTFVETYAVEANSPEEARENWAILGELQTSEAQSGEVTDVEEEN